MDRFVQPADGVELEECFRQRARDAESLAQCWTVQGLICAKVVLDCLE